MYELTDDQYEGLAILHKWYRKYNHQFIDISGVIGTGSFDLVQKFIDTEDIDPREVMYLSYDQSQVLELAARKYHSYYINGIIYKYDRIVDFNSIPILNPNSDKLEYRWEKRVRKKIDPRYKLMVIFDSVLLDLNTLNDIGSFGLPVILLRDSMLLPSAESYTYTREPDILLRDPHPLYLKNPLVYFAHKVICYEPFQAGNYNNVTIVPKKQMNLYNIKSSDMNITISDNLRNQTNNIYRDRILNQKSSVNILNERLIVMSNMYAHKLVNKDEKRIKVYLRKGIVGNITKINHHVANTKYVPINFRAEFYYDIFEELIMDRHYLNKINAPCRQIIPDETILFEYAYALTPQLARFSHWDNVTLILDANEYHDPALQRILTYTAITRAKKKLTIIQ